jgi:hypothetical protein
MRGGAPEGTPPLFVPGLLKDLLHSSLDTTRISANRDNDREDEESHDKNEDQEENPNPERITPDCLEHHHHL